MKEMIKRMREEKGGFTLAELLIVVAIILVLVAIAIPVFTGAMASANEAVAKGDIRAVKAEAVTTHLLSGASTTETFYKSTVDAQGNVSKPEKVNAGPETTVENIKDKVGKQSVDIIVKVQAEDLSAATGGTGGGGNQ